MVVQDHMQTNRASVVDDLRQDIACMQAHTGCTTNIVLWDWIGLPHLVRVRNAQGIVAIRFDQTQNCRNIIRPQSMSDGIWCLEAIPVNAANDVLCPVWSQNLCATCGPVSGTTRYRR